jgi:hypothetical protein
MKRMSVIGMVMLVVGFSILGCASQPQGQGWVTLIEGEQGLENWNRIGDANWRTEGGAIVADKGKGGMLVSKNAYQDFMIKAEFWAETDTNSGIFFRVSNPQKIGADNAYEANIWDIRPDPTYATGAIVDFAAVPVPSIHKAGGKWNSVEVYAKGAELSVKLNGLVTSSTQNGKYTTGPIALQFGAGVKGATGGAIKWRKVEIKPL